MIGSGDRLQRLVAVTCCGVATLRRGHGTERRARWLPYCWTLVNIYTVELAACLSLANASLTQVGRSTV